MNFVEFTTEQYPELLKNNIGCCVVEAWAPTVKHALDDLEALRAAGADIQVIQIKEKFGSLRMYVKGSGYAQAEPIVAKAEIETQSICSVCGSKEDVKRGVKAKNDGWILTLCKEHRFGD
jgi:hypothetical protein